MIFIWLLLCAFLHSKLELEIEGHGSSGGWARNLPTKRHYNRFIYYLLNKEITDYHIFMILLISLLFHGYFLNEKWAIIKECAILGLLIWYFILEDFFWFLCNKYIGIKKFKKEYISWHKRWVWKLPLTYWWGAIIGTGLIVISLNF